MRDKIFFLSCFGFAFGVLLRSFLYVNVFTAILIGLVSLALTLFFSLISKNKWGIIASIFILAFSLGIFRFHVADKIPSAVFESQVGQQADFSGMIADEPAVREKDVKLVIEAEAGGEKTRVLLSAPLDEDFQYGDGINFSGILQKPQNFITDQGKEFDYINYLQKDGIFYVMKYPEIEVLSEGGGNPIKRALFSVKEKFLEKINFAIPEPESLLMGGLILGERSSFGEEMRQKFIDTGTIHIIALSGYNVTIVAEWIMKAFSFLPRNMGFAAGIIGILLFVVMAGGASTAVRAGVMATLALIARATGRNYEVARALVLAGIIMILFNPFVLGFDVSFQLSFIATVAVIFLAPKIEKYFLWATKRFGLRDVISITCAAYIFVLPFILYKMGNLSLVALPANILILPFIPLTMIFGFLTGFAGIIWNILAIPFGYISYLLLHYELGIINFFSDLPFAAFAIANFPLILTLLIYAYFVYRLFGKDIKKFFTEPF